MKAQMPPAEPFDILVLGSGKGGKLLAWSLTRSGMSVAVVERPWVGGSCPAVAYLPRKKEIWSALAAYLARNTGSFGTATGAVHTVMAAILAGLPYQTLRDAVIAHLTMADGLGPPLSNLPPCSAVGITAPASAA
jgi:pyruvate/2-oxoglutarate dehydrogenase complex dihydrolipoamide dehydrogenase (E3) component